jgi:hypothetical protein
MQIDAVKALESLYHSGLDPFCKGVNPITKLRRRYSGKNGNKKLQMQEKKLQKQEKLQMWQKLL